MEALGYNLEDRIDYLKLFFRFDKDSSKVKTRAVYRKFKDLKFNNNKNVDLLKLLIEDFSDDFQLSIGAPSSPFISNIIMFEFDSSIDIWAKKNNLIYSRFADDITFSSKEKQDISMIEKNLSEELLKLKFPKLSLNTKKKKFCSFKGRVTITGLNVTPEHKLSIGRQRKKQISAMIHHYKEGKLDKRKLNKLRGWLAYCKAVDSDFVKSMEKKYTSEMVLRIMKIKS